MQFDPQLTNLIEKGSAPGDIQNDGGSAFQFAIVDLTNTTGTDEKTGATTNALRQGDLTQAKEWGLHWGGNTGNGSASGAPPTQGDTVGRTDAVVYLTGSGEAGKIQGGKLVNVRRLNQVGTYTAATGFVSDPLATFTTPNAALLMVVFW